MKDLDLMTKERDEARQVARELWRNEGGSHALFERINCGALPWLIREGPEDVKTREDQIAADHRMMRRLFEFLQPTKP